MNDADTAARSKPWVTLTIIGLNVVVFLLCLVLGADVLSPSPTTMHILGGSSKVATLGGHDWWRVVTAAFLHYGIIHLALNMFSLYALGTLVERLLGRRPYAAVYLVSALLGGVVSLLTMSRNAVSVGASGAVFGIIGALGTYLLVNRARIDPDAWKRSMGQVGLMLGVNLVYGFTNPSIDNGAHVGGLLAGAAATWLLAAPMPDAARAKRALAVAGGGVAVTLGLLFVMSR
ncbi:MAG: rhomboid family intramembrane serine protease [Deltaproteobacteria bacterium]|nr:rhomboid family intramembrane serine protease [Deltaproteobacteria bacterium]